MNTNTIDNTHKSLIIYITPTPPESMLQIFNMKNIRLHSHFQVSLLFSPICGWKQIWKFEDQTTGNKFQIHKMACKFVFDLNHFNFSLNLIFLAFYLSKYVNLNFPTLQQEMLFGCSTSWSYEEASSSSCDFFEKCLLCCDKA